MRLKDRVAIEFDGPMISYSARVLDRVLYQPGAWDGVRVGVFRVQPGKDDELVGEYERNYPSLFKTFFTFRVGERDLALYSPDYTGTRILGLPECLDLGGEERNAGGFCPVEFFVPAYAEFERVWGDGPLHRVRINNPKPESLQRTHDRREHDDPITGETRTTDFRSRPMTGLQYYPFGFVAGCVWGDDSTWKLQYLDLSRATEGVLLREERFGYLELPRGIGLAEAIDMADYGDDPEEEWSHQISIAVLRRCDLRDGSSIDPLG